MEIVQALPPAFYIALAGVVGLLVGSFLNVVAYRLPIMMERAWRQHADELRREPCAVPNAALNQTFNLWQPGSACPSCGTPIKPWQNIPVVSYLLLRGRCRACGTKISARYPIVEAVAAILALVVAWRFGPTWTAVAALGFTWTLVAATLIDVDRQLLPDSLTLPLMWAGLLLSLTSLGGFGAPPFVDTPSALIGAAAGYLSLWSVYQVFKLVTGKEGMGYGDFKLLAAIGAWTGWQLLPLVILISAVAGSVVGALLIVSGRLARGTPFAFGPFLATAGWIVLLFGDRIMSWYPG